MTLTSFFFAKIYCWSSLIRRPYGTFLFAFRHQLACSATHQLHFRVRYFEIYRFDARMECHFAAMNRKISIRFSSRLYRIDGRRPLEAPHSSMAFFLFFVLFFVFYFSNFGSFLRFQCDSTTAYRKRAFTTSSLTCKWFFFSLSIAQNQNQFALSLFFSLLSSLIFSLFSPTLPSCFLLVVVFLSSGLAGDGRLHRIRR